jgi:hypothetical protein
VSLTDAIFDEATISNTLFKDVAFTGSTFLNCRIESISLVSVVIDEVSRAQLEFALNRKLSTAEVRDVAKTLDEIDFRGILEHLQKNPELVDQLTRTQFETVLEGLVADSGHETLRASEGFNAWFLSVRKSRESDQRKACVIDYLSVPRDRAVGAAPIRKIARRIARCAYGNGLFITNGSLTYDAKRAAEAYGVSIVDRQMLLKVFADPKSLVDAISFEP